MVIHAASGAIGGMVAVDFGAGQEDVARVEVDAAAVVCGGVVGDGAAAHGHGAAASSRRTVLFFEGNGKRRKFNFEFRNKRKIKRRVIKKNE